jgi:hypothetical protein
VRGANGGSWYAIPFRVIPARGQITEDISKSGTKETWDVFQQCNPRSKNANESPEFGPQPAGVVLCEPLSGDTNWLAGEPSGEYVHTGGILANVVNVVIAVNLRPVFGENLLAPFVALAKPRGAETNSF